MIRMFPGLMILLVVLSCFVPSAQAGAIYQLDYLWEGPAPALPVHLEFKVYEGDQRNPDKLKGFGSLDFDGVDATNIVCDPFACIEGAEIVAGTLKLQLSALGYAKGKFKSNTFFEVCVGAQSTGYQQHTSCSQTILIGVPFAGDGGGDFTITGGAGTCLPPQLPCPGGDKVTSLNGEFVFPLSGCMPTDLTFNVYKKEFELVGTSTADFNGGLSNVVCDDVACITGAFISGGTLIVEFETDGYRDDGRFDSETSWELDLGSCGTFKLAKYHTSCSQVIILFQPNPGGTPIGPGSVTFTSGCGPCIVETPVSTHDKTWGAIKSMYGQ